MESNDSQSVVSSKLTVFGLSQPKQQIPHNIGNNAHAVIIITIIMKPILVQIANSSL